MKSAILFCLVAIIASAICYENEEFKPFKLSVCQAHAFAKFGFCKKIENIWSKTDEQIFDEINNGFKQFAESHKDNPEKAVEVAVARRALGEHVDLSPDMLQKVKEFERQVMEEYEFCMNQP